MSLPHDRLCLAPPAKGGRRGPLALPVIALLALATSAPSCSPPPAAPDTVGASRSDGGDGDRRAAMPAPEEMIEVAPGIELSGLTEVQRTSYFQITNTEPSACDKPHALAKSIRDDANCEESRVLGQYIADALASGTTVSDLRDQIPELIVSLRPVEIPTTGRPTLGSETAAVTVVVFADFECPHCRVEAPTIRRAVQQFRGRAKLVFKHFPLRIHPRAFEAATACEAAHKQGKFWAMHDIVFEHQTELSDDKIRGYARQIGLDMTQFEKDWKSEEVRKIVEADRRDGDTIEIAGTPAVYIDGRAYTPFLFGGSFEGWIDAALRRN